jgi:periplasmic protein TonB
MLKPAALYLPISIGLHAAAFAVAAAVTGFSSSLPHYHLQSGGPVVLQGTFAMAEPTAQRAFYLALPPAIEHGESLASATMEAVPTAMEIRRVRTSIETSEAQMDLPAEREDCKCHAPEGAIQTPKRSLDAPPEFVSSVEPPAPFRRRELSAPLAAVSTEAMTVSTEITLPSSPGGGGNAVDVLPRKFPSNRKPPYPADAYRLRQEGLVMLEVRVSAQGTVESLRVVESSGFESLDKAALDAVADWRFEPAQRGGLPAEAVVNVPVRFSYRL